VQMGAIAIHRTVRRLRRTAALLAVTCVLGGIVAVEHSGMPEMHSADLTAFCMAVLPAAALVVARRVLSGAPLWAPAGTTLKPPPMMAPTTRAARARAGPPPPLVLRL